MFENRSKNESVEPGLRLSGDSTPSAGTMKCQSEHDRRESSFVLST